MEFNLQKLHWAKILYEIILISLLEKREWFDGPQKNVGGDKLNGVVILHRTFRARDDGFITQIKPTNDQRDYLNACRQR